MLTPSTISDSDHTTLMLQVLAEVQKTAKPSDTEYYCVLYDHELFFKGHFLGNLRIQGNVAHAFLLLNDYLQTLKFNLLSSSITQFGMTNDPIHVAENILKCILEPSHNYFKLIPCPIPTSLHLLTSTHVVTSSSDPQIVLANVIVNLKDRASETSDEVYALSYYGKVCHNTEKESGRALFRGNLPRAILATEKYVEDQLHTTFLLDIVRHYINSQKSQVLSSTETIVVYILTNIETRFLGYILQLCTDLKPEEVVY
jgi:hypothetical protein